MMEQKEPVWAKIVADAIEENLYLYAQDKLKEIDFVGYMAQHDRILNDPKNLAGFNLSAAWNFGDAFFDAVKAGSSQVDNMSLDEALHLLQDALQSLRDGREIDDPRILGYIQNHPKVAWWRQLL